MRLTALLYACLLLPAAAAASDDRVDVDDLRLMTERFDAWQAAHNRTYATADERRRRFEVYRRNVEHIESTTMQFEPRKVLAARKALRRLLGVASNGSSYADEASGAVPNSVDWSSKGAVTPPRSQMNCVVYIYKTGRLVSLSEQELVDCDTPPGDHGCAGGWPGVAMQWITHNGGGLATAQAYPYQSRQGRCRRVSVASVRGGAAVARRWSTPWRGSRSPR
ncbi:hypothetical protein PR202_ga29316 [Eleusine coracana subsp. coracana]|uniref:Peptidase C1A papain C-terminal domain-containing protein n=1 Tax=Eleusine coracana subsp. coracana TaxID=191504 RepID=A0AAV5DJ79_ELECO|nr:hypothetical protein PR202_ga29316 [Eleusine coracana subsp. coracana]